VVSATPSPRRQMPISRFRYSSEYYEYRSIERIWFARSRHGFSRFQLASAVFLPMPSPAYLRSRVHPLVCLPPPYSSSPLLPVHRRSATHSVRDSVLLRDLSVSSPPIGQAPSSAFVPPTAFLTPSTVYSSSHRAGLFHPTATSEILSSGASPDTQPSWLSPARSLLTFPTVRLR
jgi:hypothetical protein